jgi:hypothetical protein
VADRGDRALGIVVGVGAIAGVAVIAYFSRSSFAATTRSPREPAAPPRDRSISHGRFPPLVERWRGEVARRAKDLPVDAVLEWIRIESGGDMKPSGGLPNEAGIFQLWFPDDAKYGATLERLRAIGDRSQRQNPADLSWLSEDDLDVEVGAGIRKILAARDTVRRVFAASGVTWPEASFDFGSAVKQIHAAPAVITELVPKIARRDGRPPASWGDLRDRAMIFPVDQMGSGLAALARAPSKYRLRNRLEDTLRNAEFVGRAWAA